VVPPLKMMQFGTRLRHC